MNAEFEERFIETSCGKVHTLIYGDPEDKLLVMLHGYGEGAGNQNQKWLMPGLAKAGYYVIAPSMPGFGRSPGPRYPSRSEYHTLPGGPVDLVRELISIFDEESAALVGYDWGAGIIISLTALYPELVESTVLFHITFTDTNNVLERMKKSPLILWVKTEQFHPYAQGLKFKEAIKGSKFVTLNAGPFSIEKTRGCYQCVGGKITEEIILWLNKDIISPVANPKPSEPLENPEARVSNNKKIEELEIEKSPDNAFVAETNTFTKQEPAYVHENLHYLNPGPGVETEKAFNEQPLESISEQQINNIPQTIQKELTQKAVSEESKKGILTEQPKPIEKSSIEEYKLEISPDKVQNISQVVEKKNSKSQLKIASLRRPRTPKKKSAPKFDRVSKPIADMTTDIGELEVVNTRGGKVVVLVIGPREGIPIVMLHGWGPTTYSICHRWRFKSLIQEGFRIFAPDMPGFGRTEGVKHNCRSETNLDEGGPIQIVEDILSHFEIQNFWAFGFSWGGGIAMSLGLYLPKRCEKLILYMPSYTELKDELKTLKQETFIMWIPIDQIHPVSLGRYFRKVIPRVTYVEIDVGKNTPGIGHYEYEAQAHLLLPPVISFVRKNKKN